MTFEQSCKNLNLVDSTLIFKPHQNNPTMKAALSINFLTEVFIVGNKNPILVMRFPNDFVIFHSAGFVKHRKDLVALCR